MGMFTVWVPGKETLACGTFSGQRMEPGDIIRYGDKRHRITEVNGNRVVVERSMTRHALPTRVRVLVVY